MKLLFIDKTDKTRIYFYFRDRGGINYTILISTGFLWRSAGFDLKFLSGWVITMEGLTDFLMRE